MQKAVRPLPYAVLVLLGSGITPAFAITVPRTVEADIVRKQAEAAITPTGELSVSAPNTMAVQVPAGAEKVKFHLAAVDVTGSSVYSKSELAESYKELLGKEVSLADMYVAAARITQRYVADGYVVSMAFLPEQKVEDGKIHIRVVEGAIKKIVWSGDPLESKIAKQMADKLLALKPLKGSDLEDVMLTINDIPQVHAKASLLPGEKDEPGALSLQIAVARKHLALQFNTNSYASRYLGVWQSSLQADYAELLSPVDQVSLNLASSVDPQYSRYKRAEYSTMVHSSGTSVKAGANDSSSAPGFSIEVLDIRSKATSYYAGITQPIIHSRAQNLILNAQFNINNQQTDILHTRLYEDRLRTVEISAFYNTIDNWSGSNLLNMAVSKGLDIFNASKTGSANLSRGNGHSDFVKLNLDASRMQNVVNNITLFTAFTAQLSDTPLLSSEEFGFGGPSFGRAYDASELSGDEGLAFSTELRYDQSFNEGINLQPYAFYDIGKIYSHTDGIKPVSGASAGLGFRVQAYEAISTDVFFAWPLTYTPATPKLGAEGKDMRLGANISLKY